MSCSGLHSRKLCFSPLKIPILFWVFFLTLRGSDGGFGPNVQPTKGAIWPKPRYEKRFDYSFAIDPQTFQFKVVAESCPILTQAIERYEAIIKSSVKYGKLDATYKKTNAAEKIDAVSLTALRIDLKNRCEQYPSDKMDESYNLTLTHNSNSLTADSIWGILRGLESFSQILVPHEAGRVLIADGISISDSPRFSHRGLLLDTARHYFPVPDILRVLDGMEYSKMNVFHWHIVDDQAFPYQSTALPELSEKGAYHPEKAVYRPSDVQDIIEYARNRGIRVIPEFDTPGHTLSWGKGLDGFLAECPRAGEYGPIDPTKKQNYVYLQKLFEEVAANFKDKYIHLGGDEVNTECWRTNSDIANFMKVHGMGRNLSLLQWYYFSRLLNITGDLNLKPVVWQEVFYNNVTLDKQTIIHAWMLPTTLIKEVVSKGYKVIYSSCWYLDALKQDWETYYFCDILDFEGSPREKSLVIGGEAAMWSEMVDESNLSPRIWPRACSTAERLWTYGDRYPNFDTKARIEEHYCRLKRRGIPAEPPNGPGYCPVLH